eukprot:2753409-Amphidinium_carterae.1
MVEDVVRDVPPDCTNETIGGLPLDLDLHERGQLWCRAAEHALGLPVASTGSLLLTKKGLAEPTPHFFRVAGMAGSSPANCCCP